MAVLIEPGMKSNSWNSKWDAVDSTSTGAWNPGRVTKITFNRGFPMAVTFQSVQLETGTCWCGQNEIQRID